MALRFHFSGGVTKPTFHRMEKFLLFFIVGGREIPMYQMLQDNLVVRLREKDEEYQTSNNILKIFALQSGYGIPKRYYSFYFRLVPSPSPVVTITPFSEGKTHFFFRGMCSFLTQAQVLGLLTEEAESRLFVKRQAPLPLDTLRAMVTVSRKNMKKNIRKIRI